MRYSSTWANLGATSEDSTLPAVKGYGNGCISKEPIKRFPLRIGASVCERIDAYGIPSGCRSRNEAITRLIEIGLEFSEKQASGHVAKQSPDASEQ